MTQQDANKIIILLTAAYPNFQPDTMAASLWLRKLMGLNFHDVERAVDAYIDTPAQFAPSIGQLKQLVISQQTDTDPVMLWHRLKRLLSYYGADRETEALKAGVPDHVKQAVECIGWKTLCRLPEEQAEAQFVAVMRSVLARPETLHALTAHDAPQLTGGPASWDNQ